MGKPAWLKVSPTSGSGNGTLSNTGLEHTGRVLRTGTVTVTAEGVSGTQTYTVNQEPKPEFCSFDNGASMSVSKDGGTVKVQGKSNSTALTFAFVGDVTDVEIPATYSAAGVSTDNGAAIDGDPGATAQFNFEIDLVIPKNETIEAITRTLKVSNGASISAQIELNQTEGDAYLTLDKTAITLGWEGTVAQSVGVSSNTSWTVA